MKMRKKRTYPEYNLQKAVCTYLELAYKDVMFLSDTVANVKLTKPQAIRNKKIQKSDFKCPDLLILEPRGGYHGLMIELKIKSPFKKNGELYKDDHLEGQAETIQNLCDKRYLSGFSWSFEMTKKIIDDYMRMEPSY